MRAEAAWLSLAELPARVDLALRIATQIIRSALPLQETC
jgi:hypothetical protein